MISIKGVIGFDIDGKQFASMISRLSGDIDIEIDSPGGLVSHGISIFNALKRYDKGKVHIHVVGECSSIAAYIMLAGDTLKFEPNSIVLLHNPWSSGIGDYRAMKKQSEVLEKLADLYANAFVEKGIFDYEAIRAYMDEEKWFIGSSDLAVLGEVVKRDLPVLDKVQKEAKVNTAKESVKAWQTDFKEKFASFDDFEELLSEIPIVALSEPINNTTVKQEKEDVMDTNELQQKSLEAFNQGQNAGVEKNQKRINALLEFLDVDKDTVVNAIREGKSIQDEEVFAKLIRAKVNSNALLDMQNGNPPTVDPKEPVLEPDALNQNSNPKETTEQHAARIEKEAQGLFESIQNDI